MLTSVLVIESSNQVSVTEIIAAFDLLAINCSSAILLNREWALR